MLNLYNTLTKSEEIADFPSNEVKIYLCGPTVQSSPHIGHGRSAVVFDFLFRYLKYLGKEIIVARNITDIDDKIIEKSLEQGITYSELTKNVSKEFIQAYAALNCLKPTYEPKATESIDEIIDFIKILEQKDIAYQTSSGVYFDITRYSKYLELSGRSIEDLLSGTRVEFIEGKKNNEDFALWKLAKENEPSWKSPWGQGRPGWHIECSAMIHGLFGNQGIDIHCGGNDLIFPHHENERAQSESAFNSKFVNFWLHNGMVNLAGKKMSKSEGNIKLLSEYLDMFDGNTIRYFFLRANYRKPQEFSENLLKESKKTFVNLSSFVGDINSDPVDEHLIVHNELMSTLIFGNSINIHTTEDGIPDLDSTNIALIGIPENRNSVEYLGDELNLNEVRKSLYNLYAWARVVLFLSGKRHTIFGSMRENSRA